MMRAGCRLHDVYPKVVGADAEATITVRPLQPEQRFGTPGEYEVTCVPTEDLPQRAPSDGAKVSAVTVVDGAMQITHRFAAEQEHVLVVDAVAGEARTPVGRFRVYSLQPDLHARRPYKGDIHLHSHHSDGRDSPAHVAAACRRIGLDFMAVTDHRRYAPSLEAQAAFAEVPCDLRIYPGEEVHPPRNPTHIINFGGRFSVNELFDPIEGHLAEVREVAEALPSLPEDVDPYLYASCVWVFEKIRAAGGLGVFCHPYWFTSHRYTPPGSLTSHLLTEQPYDALELIGGFPRHEVDSNTLQVARYHQERSEGRKIPIVGISDAHGCETGKLFGWYYTIVFSPSPDLPDLIGSIKDLYSVAVEAVAGETPRTYGPFRLVKYALFLMREVFPAHDDLCREESRLMFAHMAGDAAAAERLGALAGQTAAQLRHCWGP